MEEHGPLSFPKEGQNALFDDDDFKSSNSSNSSFPFLTVLSDERHHQFGNLGPLPIARLLGACEMQALTYESVSYWLTLKTRDEKEDLLLCIGLKYLSKGKGEHEMSVEGAHHVVVPTTCVRRHEHSHDQE